jgi:cell division septal protein FtsQ
MKKESQRRSLRRMGRALSLVVVLAALGSSALWLNEKWSTRVWEVSADEPIKAAIEAQLAAMPNKDFISMRPDRLRQQWLQSIPDLEAVRITRILPDRMRIQADARVPTALWQDEQGQLHLFDELGVAYRLLSKGESPDLPLLRVNQEQLPQAKRMLDAIAHDNKLASLSEIRASNQYWQIYFSRGVSWLIPQNNEVQVINHINRFMQQPRWHQRHWRVDARLQSRWFIRPAGQGGVI